MNISQVVARRQTVVQEILEEIKSAILEGKLKSGDKLPTEQELGERFLASRTAVREAIKMLEAIGLVEIKRGNGTYIAHNPTSSTIQTLFLGIVLQHSTKNQIYEFRKALEIGALEVIIDRCTDEDVKKMEVAIEKMESLLECEGDNVENLDAAHCDLLFHHEYMQATHNPLLIALSEGAWEVFFKSIKSSISTKEDVLRTVGNHRRILKSIKRRDFEIARKAIIEALNDWEKYSVV